MEEKKRIHWIIMWITALGQGAITLYLPAFPAISSDLKINPSVVKTTLTLFLMGYGVSQLAYGPFSDRYGRKPILILGLTIFCIGCFINLFVHSVDQFFLARFIQGVGVGSVITIGRSILRDYFTGRDFASAASYLSMGFALGLGLTPLIGAYLQIYFGWRADFGFLLLIGLGFILMIWKFLPETVPKSDSQKSSFAFFFKKSLLDYKKIAADLIFLSFLLGGLFAYGVVIAYNVMTPFLIQNILGYSVMAYGWLAVVVAIPYYISASMNRSLVLKFGSGPILVVGVSLIILAGLIMAGTALFSNLYILMLIIPIMIATFGQALIWPNAVAGALKPYTQSAGVASALLSSLQMLMAAIMSAIMAVIPDSTQLPLAFVFISLGLLSGVVLWKSVEF